MSQDFDWFIPHLGEIESLLRMLRAAGVECMVTSTDRETCYVSVANVQQVFEKVVFSQAGQKHPDARRAKS